MAAAAAVLASLDDGSSLSCLPRSGRSSSCHSTRTHATPVAAAERLLVTPISNSASAWTLGLPQRPPRASSGGPHASPHSSVFIAHLASARAQLNAGLPSLALTALCERHSHCDSSCLLPACGGSALHITRRRVITACVLTVLAKARAGDQGAPDKLSEVRCTLPAREDAAQYSDLHSASHATSERRDKLVELQTGASNSEEQVDTPTRKRLATAASLAAPETARRGRGAESRWSGPARHASGRPPGARGEQQQPGCAGTTASQRRTATRVLAVDRCADWRVAATPASAGAGDTARGARRRVTSGVTHAVSTVPAAKPAAKLFSGGGRCIVVVKTLSHHARNVRGAPF